MCRLCRYSYRFVLLSRICISCTGCHCCGSFDLIEAAEYVAFAKQIIYNSTESLCCVCVLVCVAHADHEVVKLRTVIFKILNKLLCCS